MIKELVIAAYDKPLDWIQNVKDDVKITIYRKGNVLPLEKDEIKIEPNKGRCVHTFFNHIYLNYENLSDYTFFVQDFPFDHWGNIIHVINSEISEIQKNASLTIEGYYGFHNNTLGTAWQMNPSTQFGNGVVLTCQSNGYPQDLNPNIDVDKYWNMLFSSDQPPPLNYEFIPGGHFVVTKEQIKIRTKQFYEKIIDLLLTDENSPWVFERMQCYIFNKKYKTI